MFDNVTLTKTDDNFQKCYQEMSDALTEAYDKIDAIQDKSVEHLKRRLQTNLRRDINQLKTVTGVTDFVPATVNLRKPRSLTSMFGYDVTPKRSEKTVKRLGKFPKTEMTRREFKEESLKTTIEHEGEDLNRKANQLYDRFLEIKTDGIRDAFGDEEIRAVAKLADLPVTDKTVVDTKFIDQVKDAIKKQKQLEMKEAELSGQTPKELDQKKKTGVNVTEDVKTKQEGETEKLDKAKHENTDKTKVRTDKGNESPGGDKQTPR